MLKFLLHSLQRLVVFAIGLGLIYVVVFIMLPYFNARLPLMVALLAIYCLLAYLIIPALLRVLHVIFKPNHIPMYITTPDGWPSDPVNIAIIANSKRHLCAVMRRAGWYKADRSTLISHAYEVYAMVFNKPYPRAPFSSLHLFGRPFDIGFQIPANKTLSPRSRHHVRFWQLQSRTRSRHHGHYSFWHNQLQHLFEAGEQVWIGAAIDDTHPLGIRWRDGRLTHRTDNDTDKERDFIIQTLEDAGFLKSARKLQAGEPFRFRGQQLHNKFICDGSIRVVALKNPVLEG